ncbi:MAG: hypothetical protein IJK46_04110 [Prevotella sp.]|nr:hypothetical protein [Prevotella sp.]
MENLNNMNELEEMRQQLQVLKDKVEKQGVLNEQLVRKSVKDKMKDIHHTIYKLFAMVVLVTPVWLLIKYQQNLSWPLFIFTLLMMYVSVFFDWYINRMDVDSMGSDLKETANRLVEMKKRRSLQEKIACFVVIPVWVVWLAYEFYQKAPDHETGIIMIVSMAIGLVIGGAIGLRIFLKWQHKNDEMIEQIEDLLKEE